MEKELNIIPPIGYEIDRQKSTFEKIIFKKIQENPKTWEEYCKQTEDNVSYFCSIHNSIIKSWFEGYYYEFMTEERVKQYVALGKLLQLRDYWVSNWKDDSNNSVAVIYHFEGEIVNINVSKKRSLSYSLTFPTREMAQKFIKCF